MNFLALFASKPHIFMYGALKLSGIVRANFRLNIAIAMLFLSLIRGRMATQNLKKGSEKVLGRVLEKGSQKLEWF